MNLEIKKLYNMKKLLLTTIALFLVIFAKAEIGTYWSFSTDSQYQMTVTAMLYYNGESMAECDYYEVGAFVGDECRGSYLPDERPAIPFGGGYIYNMTIYSDAGFGEVINFRMYNHQTSQEVDVICNSPIEFEDMASLGNLMAPYQIQLVPDPTPRYIITVAANPAAGGTVAGGGRFAEGTQRTVTATPNIAYNFVNWTNGGTVVSTDANYTFTVTEAADLVANFAIKTFEVNASAEPATYGTVTGSGTFEYGSTVTLTASPNLGYVFFNWTKDGEVVSTEPTLTFTAVDGVAGEYVAHFATKIYTIAATANPAAGGTVSGAGQIQEGNTCTLVATPDIAYNFVNWTKDGEVVSTNPTYSFEVLNDAAFVANFEMKTFAIVATASPASYGQALGGGTYNYGATVNLAAIPSGNYIFANWTKDGEVVSTNASYIFQAVDGVEGEYVANFTTQLYNITATVNPAETGTVTGTGAYSEGQSCTLVASPAVGYKFVNWTKNGQVVSTDMSYTFTVTGAAAYVANFEELTPHWSYNTHMQYQATATFEVTLDGVSLRHDESGKYYELGVFVGDECRGAAIPTEAPEFFGGGCIYGMTIYSEQQYGEHLEFRVYNHLVGDEAFVDCSTDIVFTANANWGNAVTPQVITLTTDPTPRYYVTTAVAPENAGTVTGAGRFKEGLECTLTATPDIAYNFVNWTKNGEVVSTNRVYTFTVMEEAEYVANFAIKTFEITVSTNPEDEGSVTGAGTYEYGQTVTLTGTPNTGYIFFKWTKNGVEVSQDATYTFTAVDGVAGEYVGHFATKVFNITASANPIAGGTVDGAGQIQEGQTCTLVATPNTGYNFVNWAKVVDEEGGGRTIEESLTYILDGTVTGGTNGYADASEITQGDMDWVVIGNTTMNPWRIGGKNLSNVDRPIYCTSTFGDNITKVVVEHGNASNITVNSMTLIVSASSNFNNPTTVSGTFTANGTTTFNRPEGADWTNKYFKIVYNVSVSGNTNRYLQFKKAEFYKEEGGGTPVNTVVVSTDPAYSFTVVEDAAYIANFELKSYEITATATPAAYGTVTGGGTFIYGTTCTLTAAPNEDFIFANWTLNGEVVSDEATYSFVVNDETAGEYVGHFARDLYQITVTANPANGGTVDGAGAFMEGQTVTLTATANTGYKFVNWTKNGEVLSTENVYSFVVVDGVEGNYVANFEQIVCHWTFDTHLEYQATATLELYIDGVSMRHHEDITFYEIGYFVGEECRGAFLPAAAPPMLGGGYIYNTTFYSRTQQGEVLHFRLYNHITEEEVDLTCSNTMTFVSNSNTGSAIMPVVVDFVSIPSYNITLAANPAEGGTVAGEGLYLEGTEITITATPGDIYNFVEWTLDDEVMSTDAEYTFTVMAEGEYVAHFEYKSYEITAEMDPEDAGEIEGEGTYMYGTECTLTAIPGEAYNFLNWTLNGEVVSTDEEIIFTVTGDAEYVANFELKTYQVTVTVNPTGAGHVLGTGTFVHGTTCTLTAAADGNNFFVNWTENDVEVSRDASYTFTVTEDHNLVANYLEYHWTANYGQFPDVMAIVSVVSIEGVEQMSDMIEIAAFVGDECRGREKGIAIPDFGHTFYFLMVTGEEGEVFDSYRLYNHETEEEYDLYCFQEIEFEADGDMGDFWEPYVFEFAHMQTTELAAGFNWFAPYIEMDGVDGWGMLMNAVGTNCDRIMSQTEYTSYYGVYGYDMWFPESSQMGTPVNNASMYRIVMFEPTTMSLLGAMADPEDHPVTINKGMNHIGFISSEPMALDEALADLTPTNGDIVKTQTDYAEYYDYPGFTMWYGSLTSINPGEGLMYKSQNNNTVTFTYPSASAKGNRNEVVEAKEHHWNADYRAYPNNMTVLAVVELADEELTSEEYELAAFADGECRGSVQLRYVEPIDRYVAFLTVSGDETTSIDLRLYNHETGEEYSIADNHIVYNTDDVIGDFNNPFVVRFNSSASEQLVVYPNPVNKGESFNVLLTSDQSAQVEIINSVGVIVSSKRAAGRDIMMDVPATQGVYTVRVITDGKEIKCVKLVVK